MAVQVFNYWSDLQVFNFTNLANLSNLQKLNAGKHFMFYNSNQSPLTHSQLYPVSDFTKRWCPPCWNSINTSLKHIPTSCGFIRHAVIITDHQSTTHRASASNESNRVVMFHTWQKNSPTFLNLIGAEKQCVSFTIHISLIKAN